MTTSLSDTVWLSEKRTNLLLLLMEGPRNIEQIKTSLNVTSRGMMPQIKKLIEMHLVVEDDAYYQLSSMGELIVKSMLPLLNTIHMLDENMDYWQYHDLSALPDHLFKRLQELGNYLLIEPDRNHTFEIPREFTQNLSKSRNIMALISFFRPEYLKFYCDLIENAESISIILTSSVFERMKKNCKDELLTLLAADNADVFLFNESNRPPTIDVSEWFLYISFLDKDGRYDHNDIMSFDEGALIWGQELFHYYQELSERLDNI
ncbi:MAG: winged helix-turn-helix domain-containing protein [Euryarchaeota archaeon]|nr:winged helix-turn-helix domain-containing protein [Euryarchaeota archaeon]